MYLVPYTRVTYKEMGMYFSTDIIHMSSSNFIFRMRWDVSCPVIGPLLGVTDFYSSGGC